MIKIIALFFVTAVSEILGCYFFYTYVKKIASVWILMFSVLSLVLFAWLLTLHPESSGRIYATYGGIYVAVSLIWLRFFEDVKLSAYDIVGAIIILLGSVIIICGWRNN